MSFPKLLYFSSFLFFSLLFGKISGQSLCVVMNPAEAVVKVPLGSHNFTCPGPSDPLMHTECCPGIKACCPRQRYFYEIDRTLASIIAITVTCSCALFALVMAVCCFWSKCPLYSACRAEFTHDIATYESKEDSIDMDTMPTEFSIKSTNKFSPVVVSNGNLPLGDTF